MNTTTPPKSTLTVNLSAEINAAFHDANTKATSAKESARQAVTRALECGRLLNRQKSAIGRGRWQQWLSANCPAISFPTARRYMMLARRVGTAGLADAAGLRQAYLATGVLTVGPRLRTVPGAECPTVSFTRPLDNFRRWFHRRTIHDPLNRWPPEDRRVLRKELAWFKQLHDRLDSDGRAQAAEGAAERRIRGRPE